MGLLTPFQRGVSPSQLGLAPSQQPGFVRKPSPLGPRKLATPSATSIARKKNGRSEKEKDKLRYQENKEDRKKKRNTPENKAALKKKRNTPEEKAKTKQRNHEYYNRRSKGKLT